MSQGPDSTTTDAILKAIAHMETQRGMLGDATVDTAVSALRKQLADLQATTQPQRKQITVLFADLSGYTALSADMDAEDVSELMNKLWRQLDEVILRHNGRIDKHLGDGVMAVWGMDAAREDDPEQAIQSALHLQAELTLFSTDNHLDVEMRIGINTGQALLTEVGTTGEYTAIGSPVNIASRLEQAAPPGGILISHETYQHVRGIFDVTIQPPLLVKGVATPLQTYVVNGLKRRTFRLGTRGIEGVVTRMIGRQAELETLQLALETAVSQQQRQMVTIIGDAGMGKSRLLHEFDTWVELHPLKITYFKGRARQETQHMPYALLRDLIAFRFQIQDNDPAEVARQKLEYHLGETIGSVGAAHIIGQLLGFDFRESPHLGGLLANAEQLRNRALHLLAAYFQTMTRRQPTVILLEDMHWADDSSLDAIDTLAQLLRDLPLLLGCAARPDFLERRPDWGEGQVNQRRVMVRPLSQTDSYLLVAEILQRAETVPDIIPQTIVRQAEGNPFYIEEMVKMLIEAQVIRTAPEPWEFDLARLDLQRLPPTLTALLQARLDSLPPDRKISLQGAAVIGRIFWDDAVRLLSGRMLADMKLGSVDLLPVLDELRQRELIYPRDSSAFAGTREFIFKHTMLRVVTYESVLKRHRRVCHRLAAEWLLTRSGDRVTEYTGLIADHLELAAEHAQAAVYLQRAGDQAAARFANTEAIAYYSRALRLIPAADSDRRCQLLLARVKLYHLRGDRSAEQTDLQALETLATHTADPQWTVTVALRWAAYYRAISDHQRTIAQAQLAAELAQEIRQPALEAEAYLQWAWGLLGLGRYDEARPFLVKAHTLAQTHHLPQIEADSLRNLGYIPWHQGDYDEARLYFAQALSVHQQIDDKAGESAALNNLGLTARHQGDYQAARDYYLQSIRIKREIGDRRGEGATLNNLGLVCWIEGDYAAARDYYLQSLAIKRDIDDRRGVGTTYNNLGLVAFSHGDYAAAREYYEQAWEIHRLIGDRQSEGLVLENLSLLFHYLGQQDAAREHARQALTISLELDARTRQAFALTNLGHALAALGDMSLARTVYGQALVLRRELRQPSLEMESLAGLARVALAEQKLAEAQTHVELILEHLDAAGLDGTDDPFRIYLTCYRVLRTLRDPRAAGILQTAYEQLQRQASRIPDNDLRTMYLTQVSPHRELVALFNGEQVGRGSG